MPLQVSGERFIYRDMYQGICEGVELLIDVGHIFMFSDFSTTRHIRGCVEPLVG